MNTNLTHALAFLVDTVFYLYILALMLRFLLQLVRADFYNPFSQALVKITNPVLVPLRRLIPGYRGWDIAALVAMYLLELIALALVLIWISGVRVAPATLLLIAVLKLVDLLLNVYFFSILLQAVLSWVSPGSYNPLTSLLWRLNEPLLRPVRRLIPPMGGLDLSPLVVLLAIQFLRILIH